MKNTNSFYTVFQVLKELLIKIFKIQPLDLLFLVVLFICSFTSVYIIFYKVYVLSFNIIWKKDFRHQFSFFNGFTQTPPTSITAEIC